MRNQWLAQRVLLLLLALPSVALDKHPVFDCDKPSDFPTEVEELHHQLQAKCPCLYDSKNNSLLFPSTQQRENAQLFQDAGTTNASRASVSSTPLIRCVPD